MPIVLDAKSGVRGELRNLETGRIIPKVIRALIPDNPAEQGEFVAFVVGADGLIAHENGRALRYSGRCRMHFTPTVNLSARPENPKRAPRNLPRPRPQTARRMPVPLFDCHCEHYACTRLATWMVSDEVETAPVLLRGRKWSTGRTVGQRFYCSWHYQPARILDARGEVMESLENLKARPD